MTPYEQVPESIKVMLESYCVDQTQPLTLYRDIIKELKISTVSTTANLYQVSESLVDLIKTKCLMGLDNRYDF